ncbi:MAG: RNA recognition motif domain-containing protein [Sphingomonadaceae bacterium]
MAMRLYVGNLPDDVKDEDLIALFGQAGTVQSAEVVRQTTGQSAGYGFVEMASDTEAEDAIRAFNGYMLDGNEIEVRVATPEGIGYPPSYGGLTSEG